ncbi:hypothetical protein VII00023_16180 [Vibrio ichthyoenteri ATCC 700023]|uniref:DUF58 domain-containing protein n=1 Tax=Vibrio ichthyoenteri ATCC 700023 TaxID=870968 RepID=F9S0B6_9VIBR|nr:DUF58 domain-containing protein [Vibrio ichthyoenteri]EGU43386.1 hypothetical protein VII00023_16180 [Vibrio ichthyoenteri ATCC 700023]
MAKPTHPPATQAFDPRLYCDYARLVRLQAQAQSFSLLPHLRAGSVLSGRHSSLFRGRGLNFEELRHYQLGDDIRNLDWKVTMRTGKPHVRSYTEEKDRNVILCIDQRSSMFFSSLQVMKSVVAAEIGAMCGWRVLKDGDRVGFVIASHTKVFHSKAGRSQNDLLAQLKCVAKANQVLNVGSVDSDEVSFAKWVELLKRMKLKQTTLILISDWHDCEEQHLEQLKQLQQHNDLLAVMVSDPLEQALPEHIAKANWVVGDGQYQLNLDSDAKVTMASEGLQRQSTIQRQKLSQLMAIKRLPHIELSTDGDHIHQWQKLVGGR